MSYLKVVKGQIIIRGEEGPTGELGQVKEYIEYNDLHYDLEILKTMPGICPHQIKLLDAGNDANPYLVRVRAATPEEDAAAREIERSTLHSMVWSPMLPEEIKSLIDTGGLQAPLVITDGQCPLLTDSL